MQTPLPSRHMTSKRRRIDVDATSLRRIDVSTTSFQRHVPAGMVTKTVVFFFLQAYQNEQQFTLFLLPCYVTINSSTL